MVENDPKKLTDDLNELLDRQQEFEDSIKKALTGNCTAFFVMTSSVLLVAVILLYMADLPTWEGYIVLIFLWVVLFYHYLDTLHYIRNQVPCLRERPQRKIAVHSAKAILKYEELLKDRKGE